MSFTVWICLHLSYWPVCLICFVGMDLSALENWRKSVNVGGSPGTGDAQPFAGENPNSDVDGGGSNGSRNLLWKRELQALADDLELRIEVSHLPPFEVLLGNRSA